MNPKLFSLFYSIFAASAPLWLASCAGYQVVDRSNPFRQYEVQTLAVPMFYNETVFPQINVPFYRQFIELLSKYPALTLSTSEHKSRDAVLVGILESPDLRSESSQSVGQIVVPQSLLGTRRQVAVPSTQQVNFSLRLLLIRNPSQTEIQLLMRDLKKVKFLSPRILFDKNIPLSSAYFNEISFDAQGKQTNFTRAQGAFDRHVESLAIQAAQIFRDEILYAF